MRSADSYDASPLGFWSPSTADMDFCEPNYAHSHYVAEFWNTLTSFAVAYIGAAGMLLCRWQRLGSEQMLCYSCLGVVGVGSVAFHATLLRAGQVLDEVPMLWAVTALVYGVAHHRADREQRQRKLRGQPPTEATTLSLGALRGALIAYSATATVLYFASGFVVFVVLYTLSVIALVCLAFRAVHRAESPTGASGASPRRLLACAALAYGGGALFLWIPGELLCHRYPLVQRLPLHALFHLSSAAGPHLGLTAFALARFEDERPSALSSLLFAGMPAIDRGAAIHTQV